MDERNNQVIFTDIAEKVKQAKAIVDRIDRVTSQVIIEARVVEANSSFNREIGFDWGTITIEAFKIGGALKAGPTTLTANNIPSTFRTDNTIGFNFSTLFGTNISIVDAKLTASELEGKATIISAPKIITLNSKKATIKQGLEVPYLERDSSGNATVRFKDVDLLLEVTPNISQDRRIVMSIFITKNDVVDPTAPEPALSTNEAKTEILVEDGDTIVIGGILKDTKKLTDQGIPGLRKLPAMGWLFRSEQVGNQQERAAHLHHPAHHPAGAAQDDLAELGPFNYSGCDMAARHSHFFVRVGSRGLVRSVHGRQLSSAAAGPRPPAGESGASSAARWNSSARLGRCRQVRDRPCRARNAAGAAWALCARRAPASATASS
ncbi:MAG: hypothetical protein MZV70_45965 [Desulfobacterales bacterium]|nr:hypothetical protein [Desulfobacterales bacterium]